MTPGTEPGTFRKASIVNLFYWNNLMHDVFYQFGFDEAAGNFQASHQFSNRTANGGIADDPVLAQAQSGAGINNANMRTRADGASGQMEFFLWNYQNQLDDLVHISSSSSGSPANGIVYIAMQGMVNSTKGNMINLYTNPVLDKTLVIVERNANATVGTSSEGCTSGNADMALPPTNDVSGKIAVIDRGSCSFAEKVLGAQRGGAVGVIVVNNVSGDPFTATATAQQQEQITIPMVMIRKENGDELKTQLLAGAVIIASLKRNSPVDNAQRDAALDNGIIAHEYAHGISNRLTGGPENYTALGGAEQGGEGWSDFLALYMTLRTDDLLKRKPAHPKGILPDKGIGNYSIFKSYDGIGLRNYLYSIDKKVNPATFAYLNKPNFDKVHAVGFIWCTMLYEMLQGFIDQYGMSDDVYEGANPTENLNPPAAAKGNNIAMRLIIEGMKLQPIYPTFVDQRDAILKADTLLYGGQHSCLIWQAFAKRGLGFAAVSGDNILGDEIESYDDPCDLKYRQIRIVKKGPVTIIGDKANVTYTINVSNLLPNALNEVLVTDTIPYPMKVVSASDGGTFRNRILKWRIPLAGHETKTLTVVIRVLHSSVAKKYFGEENEETTNSFAAQNLGGIDNWTLVNNAAKAFDGNSYWYIPNTEGVSHAELRSVNPVIIPNNGELVFFHKFATEANYDGGVVEISTDGTNWNYLPPNKFVKGGYTAVIGRFDNSNIGNANLAAFSGKSNNYQTSIATLNDYAGQSVYFRFRFTTDVAVSVAGGGWWIDNVYVLSDRTEYANVATAFTNTRLPVSLNQGVNARDSTTAIVFENTVAAAKPGELTRLTPKTYNNIVELTWKASKEDDVIKYEVERKEVGKYKFVKIGEIEPPVLYTEANSYNYTDATVANGKKYEYRVKQLKDNSAVRFTNIAAVEIGTKGLAVNIFPNPSDEVANINIENPGGDVITIQVFDAAGKKLATFKSDKMVKKLLALPVKSLKPGTYWVEVASGKEHKTVQLIKQ